MNVTDVSQITAPVISGTSASFIPETMLATDVSVPTTMASAEKGMFETIRDLYVKYHIPISSLRIG